MGGFPEYFSWKNAYGEEAELSLKLLEKGKKLFFNPDPKLYVIHMKFGTQKLSNYINHEYCKIPFKILLKNSNVKNNNTGNRTTPMDWINSKIISYFVIFLKRDVNGARKWMDYTYNSFVVNNSSDFIGDHYLDVDKESRRKIWMTAIIEGIKVVNGLKERSMHIYPIKKGPD